MNSIIQKLERRRWVATTGDIAGLAQQLIPGEGVYLKCLIATTQQELNATVRIVSAKKPGRLKAAEIDKHMAALQIVHDKFYAIIKKAAECKKDAIERNRATGFARTAVSALRTWVRAGYDLTTIAAAKTTQRSLLVASRDGRLKTPMTVRLGRHLDRITDFVGSLKADLDAAEKDQARQALELALGQLQTALMDLGTAATHKATVAVRDHRPLKVGEDMFWPTFIRPAAEQQAAA